MNYEDEYYVRLYTRDTANWLRLPWQARCILPLIMRKLDRAGVLDDLIDLEGDLAALIDVPSEVVTVGLAALLSTSRGLPALTLNGATLVMPNFLPAQQARTSDRLRTQESRERRRARASDPPSPDTEDSSNLSHGVTTGHTASHGVTLAQHSLASRAEQSRAEHTQNSAEGLPAEPSPPAPPSTSETKLVVQKANKGTSRGTRIPDGWQPKPETIEAFREKDHVDAAACIPDFVDYWISKAGAAGLKLDWEATFRMWVRTSMRRGEVPACAPRPRNSTPPKPAPDEELINIRDHPEFPEFARFFGVETNKPAGSNHG